MDVYEALYTTRAMRRVKPDLIALDVQARILDAAIRAPSGGNQQGWRFLLVDDPDIRNRLGPIYRACVQQLFDTYYKDQPQTTGPGDVDSQKAASSSLYMAENFEIYPLLLFTFTQSVQGGDSIFPALSDQVGSSILPAVWSAMLAARADGVGSTLTIALALRNDEVTKILGVPKEGGWQMLCCVPMGYPTGRWGIAPRLPADQVAFRNQWGTPVGLDIPSPLWPAK